jgi:hypothetical protein
MAKVFFLSAALCAPTAIFFWAARFYIKALMAPTSSDDPKLRADLIEYFNSPELMFCRHFVG